MELLSKGRYRARIAQGSEDMARAQALRHMAFFGEPGRDADPFDPRCLHVLIEEVKTGTLRCCFRLLPLKTGADLPQSYSAQYYDLDALQGYEGPMMEMGRFCIDPASQDADVLRVAWGAMTKLVEQSGAQMLFGCSSFQGMNAETYMDAFAVLHEKHLAPKRWLPKVKAPRVFRFAQHFRRSKDHKTDRKRAMLRMPPLLKTYLLMGGWVSDHAVVDPEMNTLHVFTALEINAIPPGRAKLLRATAS